MRYQLVLMKKKACVIYPLWFLLFPKWFCGIPKGLNKLTTGETRGIKITGSRTPKGVNDLNQEKFLSNKFIYTRFFIVR